MGCLSKRGTGGGGHLSVQSGDIVYDVSESDVDILLSRDDIDQSTTGSSHGPADHQEVSQIRLSSHLEPLWITLKPLIDL